MARNYSSIATEKVLAADVTNVATQITLNNITNLPSPPYTLVINPDTAIEEIVTVDADQSGVTAPTIRVTRAQEGTTAQVHTVGNTVKHMITARDLQEPQDHIAATENIHGISDTAFLTYNNASQTLTNKTMSGSANSFSNIPQSAVTDLVSDLAATDTALSSHSSSTSGIHGVTGNVVGTSDTQTLTNKTLTSPKINDTVGVTASSTELNILDGATLSTTELNYVDGVTSSIQSQINTIVNTTIPNAMPVGTIVMFGGTVAPTGWLLCNGQSTTGYTALAGIVGPNVPDLRGRAPIGYGAGPGLTNRSTIGATVGSETVTLTEAQMPSHSHSLNPGQVVGGGHLADPYTGTAYSPVGNSPQANTVITETGEDQAHENMQPSTVVNFIIKH